MGARFWIRRFFLAYTAIYFTLLVVEWIKGHSWRTALGFSGLWASISAILFVGTRLYYASRGQACALCKDTPEQG